jgi:hypothetical protein
LTLKRKLGQPDPARILHGGVVEDGSATHDDGDALEGQVLGEQAIEAQQVVIEHPARHARVDDVAGFGVPVPEITAP